MTLHVIRCLCSIPGGTNEISQSVSDRQTLVVRVSISHRIDYETFSFILLFGQFEVELHKERKKNHGLKIVDIFKSILTDMDSKYKIHASLKTYIFYYYFLSNLI